MATASVDQATLKRTMDTLRKITKKPPLSEKLLNRPPFRFLHDIIREINKATGWFDGLYAGTEWDPKSFQDKESKMAFLQKAIDVLSFVQGEVVKVKASKIVAGQEAEKTNEFLQLLAIAILKKLDSSEAIQRVLNGERPAHKRRGGGKKEGGTEGGREGREEGEKPRGKERPPEAKGRSRGDRPKEGRDREGKRQERERKRDDTQEQREERVGEGRERERGEGKQSGRREDRGREEVTEGSEIRVQERRETESGEDEGLGSETKLDRPPSARGGRRHVETGENEEGERGEEKVMEAAQQHSPSPPPSTSNTATTQPQPPSLGLVAGRRPGSARPAPPRVVTHSSEASHIDLRGSMESSVAPPTVIMDTPGGGGGGDNEDNEDEGGEGEDDREYVVADSAPLAPPTTNETNVLPSVEGVPDKPEGVLTKTIVATKERLEGGGGEREGGLEAITPAQRRREIEAVRKEMEKLREDIQLLCRYTNPMGRVMDYLQEDTDTMIQELERWRAENNSHRESLRREESVTENELAPIKSQLEEVELHIQEQREKISTVKATIIRQDNSMRQLMQSIVPHS